MKKLSALLLLIVSFFSASAQGDPSIEMADVLRSSGKIYVVVATIAIIFVVLAIYLFSIDRRLKKIEKEN